MIPNMFCRRCGAKLLVKDRSKDERHIKLMKGLAEMGMPCSPYMYYHPKGIGCYSCSESSGVASSKTGTSQNIISEAEKI